MHVSTNISFERMYNADVPVFNRHSKWKCISCGSLQVASSDRTKCVMSAGKVLAVIIASILLVAGALHIVKKRFKKVRARVEHLERDVSMKALELGARNLELKSKSQKLQSL